MANVDTPFGFKPVRHLNGNPYNGQFNVYYCDVDEDEAIYLGDAVKTLGSADVLGKYPTVEQADAGDAIRGVVVGFSNTPYVAADVSDLTRVYRPGSTAMYIHVADDPQLIFEVQEDNLNDTLVADDVGSIANLVATAGSSTTGLSAMELDSTEGGQTSSKTFMILGLVDRPGNVMGNYAKWNVMAVLHELAGSGLAGI